MAMIVIRNQKVMINQVLIAIMEFVCVRWAGPIMTTNALDKWITIKMVSINNKKKIQSQFIDRQLRESKMGVKPFFRYFKWNVALMRMLPIKSFLIIQLLN